jgi:arylsulfatase
MSDSKPHIILITCDELRQDSLSCYGNRVISTPNIDRLAQRGTTFNNAYTNSPWCLPSRCSLATGLYPHNNGSYSNFRNIPLDRNLPNIYSTLKKNSYITSHFGKCHYMPVPYSDVRSDATLPYDEFREFYRSLGIDHLALQDGNQVSVWYSDDYSKELDEAGYLGVYRDAIWDKFNRKVFDFPAPDDWHPDSWVGRKATEYITNYEDDSPLFAWISFSGPHYPFDPPQSYAQYVNMGHDKRIISESEFDDPSRIHASTYHGQPDGAIDGLGSAPNRATKNYTDKYWYKLRQSYFANIVQIDENIGQILDAVENEFGDNCLLIFTADHGEMLGNHGLWGKNNCAYDDVWRVPLLVRFPQQTVLQTTHVKTMLVDILPTCMDVAGIPDIDGDGVSLAHRIEGGGTDFVIAEGEGFFAITDGTYKFIRVEQSDRSYTEFLDLSVDPYELKNEIYNANYADRIADLQAQATDLLMQHSLK